MSKADRAQRDRDHALRAASRDRQRAEQREQRDRVAEHNERLKQHR